MNNIPSPGRVAEAIAGPSFRKRVRGPLDLLREVERGLPVSTVGRVARQVSRTPAERVRVEGLIGPRATLERKARRKEPLSLESSERVARVARLALLAEYVLESHEAGVEFLQEPHRLLGGKPPIMLARTDLGARQVEDLLWKLEYSLPA